MAKRKRKSFFKRLKNWYARIACSALLLVCFFLTGVIVHQGATITNQKRTIEVENKLIVMLMQMCSPEPPDLNQ